MNMRKNKVTGPMAVAAALIFAALPYGHAADAAEESKKPADATTPEKQAVKKSTPKEELDHAKAKVDVLKKRIDNLNKDLEAAKEAKDDAKAKSLESDIGRVQADLTAAEGLEKTAQENYKATRSQTYFTHGMSLKDAQSLLKSECPNFNFKGDVVWLASTYVDGTPLYRPFVTGMPKDAARRARNLAIEAGFYMAAFEVSEDGKDILVDKGRLGAVNVSFIDESTGKTNEVGRMYTRDEIKKKFGQGRSIAGAKQGEVFNFNDVKDRFYELNGLPDIDHVDISFIPGDYAWDYEDKAVNDKKHSLTMDVYVQEEDSYWSWVPHGVFGIDNFGSLDGEEAWSKADEFLGRATLQWLDFGGGDNALTINGSYSLEGSLWGVSGGYLQKFNRFNATIHGGYTHVEEDDVVENVDVFGTGWFSGLQLSFKLWDFAKSDLNLSLGATYRNVENALRIEGTKYEYGRDGDGYELIPLSVALMYTERGIDSWGGRNYATLEGIHNVGGSSADELKYFRASIEKEDYWQIRAQLARLQLLSDDFDANDAEGLWMLFARAEGLYSDSNVVGAEQFGIGGHNSVRGYRERQFMGDNGFSATLELRSPILLGLFDRTTRKASDILDRWQFVFFADCGSFWLHDAKGQDKDDKDFIYSVGAGFRLALSDRAQLRCDVGVPLVKDNGKKELEKEEYCKDDVRLHLSLQFQW